MKKQILIIEDDAFLNEAFVTILTKEKYTVHSAFNGQEALDFLKENTVDLILLDLLMPTMSGIEFLKAYDARSTNTPVIVFSNLDRQKDIDEVMQLGATRYMLKSWASPKELARIVKDTLNEHAAS